MVQLRKHHVTRIAILAVPVLAVLALVAAWTLLLSPATINTKDPVVVAYTFLTEIQADHPNRAYQLTSKDYKKAISLDDFGKNLVSDLSGKFPQSVPKLFSTAYPPDGKKQRSQVVFNIPADGAAQNYRAAVELRRSGDNWSVEGLTAGAGQATRTNTVH